MLEKNKNTEFQITPDDYVSAGLLNGEMTSKAKYIHYAIDTFLVVIGIAALYFEKYIWAGGLIGAAIGGNMLPLLLRNLYSPWYLRRHYKKYKAIKKPISISILDEGIKFSSESGEGLLNWQEIHHWREGRSMILIYLAPRIYHMVPKRIAEAGFPLRELKEKLIGHVGNAT